MKTLKCDLCEHEEQAQTFEEWMEARARDRMI